MGMIYRRGKVYWIKYYVDGKPVRMSSSSHERRKAELLLTDKEKAVARRDPAAYYDTRKTRYDDIRSLVIEDYKLYKRKSLNTLEYRLLHLDAAFKGKKAELLDINRYILDRRIAGAEDSTINRELAALRRMFTLALRNTPPLVVHVPRIARFKENNVRIGFIEHEAYLRLKGKLPDYLNGPFTLAYHAGMRREEILSLPYTYVSEASRTINLEPGTTKNDEPRVIHLEGNPELEESVKSQLLERMTKFPDCPYLYSHDGEKIKDFRGAWDKALLQCGYRPTYRCKQCHVIIKLPEGKTKKDLSCFKCGGTGKTLKKYDKVFHDLRRTALRNMIRAGVPQKVAMKISGHKTASVFDRYDITSDEDLREASKMIAEYHKAKERNIDVPPENAIHDEEHDGE